MSVDLGRVAEARTGEVRFSEDLPQLAVEAFEAADRFCDSCKNFHVLWPYHRLAKASGGDVGAPLIHTVLSQLLSQRGRRILIAGCADSGLLAVVARAANSDTDITVLDRCETPLELCRRFAHRWSLPIQVLHQDLRELTAPPSFDVVFAHMVLQFIPADRCLDVLARMRRSLRPGGRLVLAFRASPRIEEKFVPEYARRYALDLIDQLEAGNIALPEPREDFRRRLEAYFEERRAREGTHTSRAEVEQLIKAAGLAIDQLMPIDADMSQPFHQFCATIRLQRFVAVASASA
jgi:SAM-dependent methyltransferase